MRNSHPPAGSRAQTTQKSQATTMSGPIENGQKFKGIPDDGCAKCMFCCFTCGSNLCCPWTSVVKVDGDVMVVDENTYCLCIRASPCPCLGCCCCDGPHTTVWKFKKESETKWVGMHTSQWKGGCCEGMCHNEGDEVNLRDGVWYWKGGKNPSTPPCFQGKEIMHWEIMGGGAPPLANATMER